MNGTHRANERLANRRDELEVRHKGQTDQPTRQTIRAAARAEKALADRAAAKVARMEARRALSKRKVRAPERPEPRGLGWIGHLHSHARFWAGFKAARAS